MSEEKDKKLDKERDFVDDLDLTSEIDLDDIFGDENSAGDFDNTADLTEALGQKEEAGDGKGVSDETLVLSLDDLEGIPEKKQDSEDLEKTTVLGIDEIGIIFPVGDVAALDLPGQGGCAVFGIVRAGAEGGAQGADNDVVVLYPQGDVLVDVLHGFGPQQLAGEVGMGLIELGDETIPGDIHSGRGAAVSLSRFLHAIGDGFELIHDDTSLSADNIPNRQYSTLSANCHLEFHISFCPFGTGGFVDFSLRRGYT